MHTLSDLQAGQLAGLPRINIAADLTEFPRELFNLVDTLEILNLSGNQLTQLPDDFDRFTKLRILFLSDNHFKVFPKILARCPELEMVGFKANRITDVSEASLPKKLRWLILTDNQINKLPSSIGEHTQLQKLMLAGNQLTSLPIEMAKCTNLELLRISANQLEELPQWLVHLPKLSWLAFAGNPYSDANQTQHSLPEIHWGELELGHQLGEGASGIISKATWQGDVEIALKEFKGAVTSDGFPADEMSAAMAVGQHDNLVEVIGQLTGHPEQKEGLLLSLIADDFRNLAGPPCLDSCTRDTYTELQSFSLTHIINISTAIASAATHLHQGGITHGDLYGHNILINENAHCLLGDFGAATSYQHLSEAMCFAIERLEVRAFGCLLEELLLRIQNSDAAAHSNIVQQLHNLQHSCCSENTQTRPLFVEFYQTLITIKQ